MAVLSIIIPVYNKEKYIDACLQSILGQSFTDFELLLINDGSTDESALICSRYQNLDKRVILINKANGGVSSARNLGLSKATGKYIGFIDSDDTIEPDMYEILIRNIENKDADVSVCRLKTIFPDKVNAPAEEEGVVLLNRAQAMSLFLKEQLDMSANNKIYKAELAKSVLFTGSINEDILYLGKIFLKAETTCFENVVKYNYIVRDNSVSVRQFNIRYLETISVSSQIEEMVRRELPECLAEAQAFDVTANISLLNLLLLFGNDNYEQAYQQVKNKLKAYGSFINSNPAVRRKHKIAYNLFSLSPWLYTKLTYLYGIYTKSAVIKRTKKQPSVV